MILTTLGGASQAREKGAGKDSILSRGYLLLCAHIHPSEPTCYPPRDARYTDSTVPTHHVLPGFGGGLRRQRSKQEEVFLLAGERAMSF